MTLSGSLSPADIEFIRIYTKCKPNTVSGMKSILQETGGDIVFNGTIFLKHFKPCTHLKADGKVLKSPNYTAWTVSWNNPSDFGIKVAPNKDANYMQCVRAIINGKPVAKMDYQPDMYYATNRTAIGTKNGNICYYVTQDNLHPEQLQNRLVQLGWDGGLMMDGGGSTAIWTRNGQGFAGDGRTIPFWFVIKKKATPVTPPNNDRVISYSRSKDGDRKISEHFRVREFSCKDDSDPLFVSPELIKVLEKIRVHFNKPLIITNSYRTPTHNKKVGGSPHSQHLYGKAADIYIKGISPDAVANYARSIMPSFGGVGRYDTFTHVDVRDTRSDW